MKSIVNLLVLVGLVVGSYYFINRPTPLSKFPIPNTWPEAKEQWLMQYSYDEWPYAYFYETDLKTALAMERIYHEWEKPSELKEMKRLYSQCPACFPEYFEKEIELHRKNPTFTNYGDPLGVGIRLQKLHAKYLAPKKELQKKFKDLEKICAIKRSATSREVFGLILKARETTLTGGKFVWKPDMKKKITSKTQLTQAEWTNFRYKKNPT